MLEERSARRIRGRCAATVVLAVLTMATPPPAHSDASGAACVQAMVRSVDHVTAVHAVAVRDCARRSALGGLPGGTDLQDCLDRKDEGPLRRYALEATLRREKEKCVPAPSFGYAGGVTVNRAASDWELQIGGDFFGAAFTEALVTASEDAAVSACQLGAMRGYGKLRSAALDGVLRCLHKIALSDASWTPAAVGDCIDGSDNEELTKLVRAESLFKTEVAATCAGVSLPRAFPGVCASAATSTAAAACLVRPARCRTCRMAEVALGVVANCETFDNGQADGSCPADASACGNGITDSGEECDSTDLGGRTCASLGFAAGNLQCSSSCTLDTRGCTHCGDSVVEADEQCDGSELAGASCQSLGFETGTLSCSAQCSFDTAGCTVCGDGTIGGLEQCDGSNLGGQTCASQGFNTGTLACNGQCQLDTSSCYRCGDGSLDPGEQCDGANLGGQTCASLGFVAGQLSCSQQCNFETALCFADCNEQGVPPADLKFGVGDSLWLFGDSITSAFHENRYHYGKILLKVLGSSYCSYSDGFSIHAVGRKGVTYAHYKSYVRRNLPGGTPGPGRQWVMFQDSGKTVKLANDRFVNAVRGAVAAAREIDPDSSVMLGTTPPLEERPDRPGICSYYSRVCNFVAHNDIVTHLSEELAADPVLWDEDFCRLLWRRPSLLDLEFTTDGIHPRPSGNLGLALSILKWAGVPRQDLVLSGLQNLHPDLTIAESEQIADWIYDPVVYDCTEILEECGEPGQECLDYLSTAGR